jgi:hypothetical protein
MMIRKKMYLTRAVLPALLFDQTLQFRRAVTRMFWPIGNELLLTFLAPDIFTTFHGAMQVPRLAEPLSVEITRSAATVRPS